MAQRIMLVYTKAGGGHFSLAQTLNRVIEQLEPDSEVMMFNFFDTEPRWIGQAVEEGYNFTVNKQRWIFTILSAFSNTKLQFDTIYRLIGTRLGRAVNDKLEQFKPDKIIYCYPANHGFRRLRYYRQNKPKTLTIVSDFYSPHLYWFVDTKDQYVVASVDAYSIARRYRIPAENLHFFQNLIDPKYADPMPETDLAQFKHELELPHTYTVLVTGGGPGLKNTKKYVEALLTIEGINIVVICGYNERLYGQLETLRIKRGLEQLKLFKFTKQMYELINASDVVITKAGPATITEVISQHKDLIVCDYIWPQEAGNVEMIQREKIGYFIRNPKDIASKVAELKAKRSERKTVSLPNDLMRLAEYILKL